MTGTLGRQATVTAADGHALAATFFEPAAPRGAVLVVPAMGVPQSYYAAFARWLAAQGYAVTTFDYRGIGASRRGHLRDLRCDLLDWARLDCAAVLAAAAARAPGRPLYWIGHSLGGQILPFVPGHERVEKMITVATGSGYWRENAAPLRRRVWFLWFLVAPLAVRLFGYFPGRRLGMVGDLPRGVIEQWRRWCLNRDYAAGVEPGARERYAAVRVPIVSLSFSDDELMSARNIESIHGFYTGAPRIMRRVSPAQAGVRQIGHFAFFRPDLGSALWPAEILAALESPSRAAA